MVIYYHKKTKQIIATFPGVYEEPKGISLSLGGVNSKNIGVHILSSDESYDFEDPRNPLEIHDHKVILDKSKQVISLKKLR